MRNAKRECIKANGFPYDHFHGVQYGATKADSVRDRAKNAILIDDNEKVRAGWHLGKTIDPTQTNVIEELLRLLMKGE